MRKILLTSAGFENKKIEEVFIGLVGKASKDIKAIFVPTAAIFPDAKAVLPKCKLDLLNAGILEQNITIYDLDRQVTYDEISDFDAIYFCGGSTKHLRDKINEMNFLETLKEFIDKGRVYIGVSAGSCVLSASENGLGLINCTISVHNEKGSDSGPLDTTNCPHVNLTNNQAILIVGYKAEIIE